MDRIPSGSTREHSPPGGRAVTTSERYTPSRATPIPRRRNVAYASPPTRIDGETGMTKSEISSHVVALDSFSKGNADTVR